MERPTARNRLDEAASPYLRQHADNPVNWQPWDETALEAARERDVPIFLSIGYSACHWCHVMESESFADDRVAEVLNDEFVPIKVDREERPDVDTVYMTVCQLVTGQGGWPLSVWLTPDGKPFYVGTYFPREARRGQPGFLDVLDRLQETWDDDRDEVERRAEKWADAARSHLETTPDADEGSGAATASGSSPSTSAEPGAAGSVNTDDRLTSAADAARRSFDGEYGGFGSSGPKFPQPTRLDLLFRAHERTGREGYRDAAIETLDAMAAGGLYDHVGGGFHRYCVDREWTVPHFEKMLYDNAEIPRAFLTGYQVTGTERYADVVRETLSFLERELRHPDGAFFSTLDAQSETPAGEREEGAFYVWTTEAVADAVDDETDADLVCERFGITDAGNFEGQTVLNVERSVPDLADEFDLEASTVETRLERATGQLFDAREERPRPPRDEKVLAGWNGLAIGLAAEASIVLGDDAYAAMATDALEFVREHLWDADEGRLHRRFKDGDVGIDGYLEDYAFLARGALRCYEATGEVDHLAFALDLTRVIESEFWAPDRGTLYFTPESGESLVTRPQELSDQSTPASAGVAVEVLQALDHFVPDDFADIAETVLDTHADRIAANPLEHVTLALAADRRRTGPLEVTMAATEVPTTWRDRFAETYHPDRLLAPRPPTDAGLAAWLDRLGLDEAPPIWAGREARDDEPTLYVCRNRTCSPPTGDVDEALAWADDTGVTSEVGADDAPESPF